VQLKVIPNPIVFAGFNYGHGRITFTASWTVTVQETAGVPVQLLSLRTSIHELRAGDVAEEILLDAPEIARRAGSARVPSKGSLAIAESWVVSDPFVFACSEYSFEIEMRGVDDEGHDVTSRIEVPEAPRPHPCTS
jgi:hypothetical protein